MAPLGRPAALAACRYSGRVQLRRLGQPAQRSAQSTSVAAEALAVAAVRRAVVEAARLDAVRARPIRVGGPRVLVGLRDAASEHGLVAAPPRTQRALERLVLLGRLAVGV